MKPKITALYYCDYCGEEFTETMPEDDDPFEKVREVSCPHCESGYIPECVGYCQNSDIKNKKL